jgi:aldehyde:ferredoxin oxidoreductase
MEAMFRTGESIFNLKRLVNVRRCISRKDDMLPVRMLTRKRGGQGPAAENLPHLGAMLNESYACRGWSEEGIPTPQKLTELELSAYVTTGL